MTVDLQIVSITGGVTRIDLACAQLFRPQGHRVIIWGLRQDILHNVAAQHVLDHWQVNAPSTKFS